jgi:hypothetical protein
VASGGGVAGDMGKEVWEAVLTITFPDAEHSPTSIPDVLVVGRYYTYLRLRKQFRPMTDALPQRLLDT